MPWGCERERVKAERIRAGFALAKELAKGLPNHIGTDIAYDADVERVAFRISEAAIFGLVAGGNNCLGRAISTDARALKALFPITRYLFPRYGRDRARQLTTEAARLALAHLVERQVADVVDGHLILSQRAEARVSTPKEASHV